MISKHTEYMSTTQQHTQSTLTFFNWHNLCLLYNVREGTGIWADRQNAVMKCERNIARNDTTCVHPTEVEFQHSKGMTHKDFLSHMVQYPFIVCVHGGGMDPSPKAWEALMLGMITT